MQSGRPQSCASRDVSPAMAADLRQACDRCHDKKLRCPKPPGSLGCTRCAKAGILCVFSPPTRPARPGTVVDGPPAGLSPLPTAATACTSGGTSVEQTPAPSRNGTRGVPNDSASTERLMAIMLALDGLLREIPPDGEHHVPQERLKEYADGIGDKHRANQVLEAVLDHAQQLAHLQPAVLQVALQKLRAPDPDQACLVPNCIHEARGPLRPLPGSKIDHALLSLLVACNLRLLDLLDMLIRSCVTCATTVTRLMPESYGPKLSIPEVRIGSVVASKATASSVVISAIFESLITTMSCAKDTSARLQLVSDEAPREVKVLVPQYELLTERTQATFAEIVRLRGDMAHLGALT